MSSIKLSDDVRSVVSDVISIRRDVHQNPEMGFKETRTSDLIVKRLQAYGVEAKRIVGTGVLGIIKGAKPGTTIPMRADIDGLPVVELNEVPYRSKTKGVMHACGHDGHVAMAL